MPTSLRFFSVLALFVLAACEAEERVPSETLPPPGAPGMAVSFLDVGQGDAIVVRFPDGSAMLVDGGPDGAGEETILPALDALGVEHLDVLVLTHPHADHCGGLDEVLEGVGVGVVWENGEPGTSGDWDDFDDAVDDAGVARTAVTEGYTTTLGGCDIVVLGADRGASNPNDDSVVLRIACEGGQVLLTGDVTETAQRALLAGAGPLRADVVKVPHHGSKYRADGFADEVAPDVAVISCGLDNRYEHPNAGTVAEWTDVGATVYRTDLDGTVSVTLTGGQMDVRTDH